MNETIRKDPRAIKENEHSCVICKKFFVRRGERKYTAKYCSQKCHGIGDKGKKSNKKRNLYINGNCKICKKSFSFWKSENKKYCSRKCYFNSEKKSGELHWNWKGGITPKNQIERKSKNYARWRKKVFIRDDFTCKNCNKKGGKLEAHHIKPWAENKESRFIIKNGLTLCKKCHEKTDSYRRRRK